MTNLLAGLTDETLTFMGIGSSDVFFLFDSAGHTTLSHLHVDGGVELICSDGCA